MYPADILQVSLRELGWSRPATIRSETETSLGSSARFLPNEIGAVGTSRGCWLSRIFSADHSGAHSLGPVSQAVDSLTPVGRAKISSILQMGWTLRDAWPKHSEAVVSQWLGGRLYFASAARFYEKARLTCIVSSRIGRSRQQLSTWPFMLDWALRTIQRDRSILLRAPRTTLSTAIDHFGATSGIPSLNLSFPKVDSGGLKQASDWLTAILRAATNQETPPETIYVSPAFQSAPALEQLDRLPVQDRAAIAMADRVLAILVRPSGTIARLLERRLQDNRFPPASVLVAIENGPSGRYGNSHRKDRASSTALRLLSQGAVGWLVLNNSADSLSDFSRCGVKLATQLRPRCLEKVNKEKIQDFQRSPLSGQVRRQVTQQLCAPAEKLWNHTEMEWTYLTHCTRGNSGALPQETQAAYFDRLWCTGFEQPGEPLWTLVRILREQRLRGTTWMTRGSLPSVSLSEVPLKELLGRRHYQSHLGRWDWEPYGLIFSKRTLSQVRPVIYGLSSDYERLPAEDRVYFQPVDSKYDWKQEREWRMLGDLDLSLLPSNAVTVFVRSQLEAVQLARESRFPVLWTEGIHS